MPWVTFQYIFLFSFFTIKVDICTNLDFKEKNTFCSTIFFNIKYLFMSKKEMKIKIKVHKSFKILK